MIDPFSVTGTAVGITSLGIQACQGLVRYYSEFRSYHEDINVTIQRLEGLQAILEVLDLVKEKVELDNDGPPAQLHLALQACSDGVRKLGCIVRKCGETKMPDTLEDRLRLIRKRLLWPFKRDTLSDMQRTLDRLQASLQLALHILHM